MNNEEARMWFIQESEKDITEGEFRAFSIAIKALEKQIPKKPIIKDGHCYCPNKCSSVTKDTLYWTVGRGENYCDRCGQAIDWSEDEA